MAATTTTHSCMNLQAVPYEAMAMGFEEMGDGTELSTNKEAEAHTVDELGIHGETHVAKATPAPPAKRLDRDANGKATDRFKAPHRVAVERMDSYLIRTRNKGMDLDPSVDADQFECWANAALLGRRTKNYVNHPSLGPNTP